MLSGVFHLHEQEARQVMTPIPAVVTVDTGEDVETALRRCVSTGHTRLVVTEDGNRDRVRGIVHANALARIYISEGPSAPFDSVILPAPIIPETKPLDDLLAELQRQRMSMAVVVDEYGRVAGIVTIEDVIEEVVGEIDDETDPRGGDIRRLANGDWFVRGHVAVTDLQDYGLELPVDTDAYNSVGGFVFAELGRLPRRGDTVSADGYSIRVESVRENRIEAVRIRPGARTASPAPQVRSDDAAARDRRGGGAGAPAAGAAAQRPGGRRGPGDPRAADPARRRPARAGGRGRRPQHRRTRRAHPHPRVPARRADDARRHRLLPRRRLGRGNARHLRHRGPGAGQRRRRGGDERRLPARAREPVPGRAGRLLGGAAVAG